MKVYEVIKDCSITYTRNGEDNRFALYPGDYFFIKHDAVWVKKESRLNYEPAFSKSNVLVKIYYNKMIDLDGNKEWTLIDDINLVDPRINQITVEDACKFHPIYGQPVCKDITAQWDRDQKLNQLI